MAMDLGGRDAGYSHVDFFKTAVFLSELLERKTISSEKVALSR